MRVDESCKHALGCDPITGHADQSRLAEGRIAAARFPTRGFRIARDGLVVVACNFGQPGGLQRDLRGEWARLDGIECVIADASRFRIDALFTDELAE